MVTVNQASGPPASFPLLFNHITISNFSLILVSWRQMSGDNSKLWLLVVVVKTTEEKAEPPDFPSVLLHFLV